MAGSGGFLRFLEIVLDFIARILENKLALVMLFVLAVDAVLGPERMEYFLNLIVDAVASLIPG